MGQVRKSFLRAEQELKGAGEYPRLGRYGAPTERRAQPVLTVLPQRPCVREQASGPIPELTAQPEIAASWFVAESLPPEDDSRALSTGIDSARWTTRSASDWFSRLAKLIECQVQLRDGDLARARQLASELIDFDAPVDIELSIFYPLCIEALICNRECDKALRLVDQLLALLNATNSIYKTNLLVLRARANQGKNNGEVAMPLLDVDSPVEPLTERELEILRLLRSHLPTPEIADMMALSVNTVRTHIKSVYAKLGVHSRTTAVDVSQKLKILV